MVYQSIIEKKYIIGLPSNLDQYLMMTLAHTAGFGELIRAGKVNSHSIERAVNYGLSYTPFKIPNTNYSLSINKITALIDNVKNSP